MGLKKAENQVKMLIGDTIVALCRNTLNHHAEVNVEGILGITLDNEEIFLVNINQTIRNSEGASRNKEEALKRTASSNDKNDKSSSDDSSSEDSGDQSDRSPKRKRRRRHRKKRRSHAPGDKDTSACADGLQLSLSGQRHSKPSENSTTGINTNSMVSTECTGLSNVDQNAASYSQVTFTQSIIENVAQTDSSSSHSNNAQVPSEGSSMLQVSCLQPNSAPNVIVTTNPSANFDTGQNGIMNVKQELLPDDENDEDLVIIKEEMDSEHPSPVLVFPNVSQTFHGDSILMGTPAYQQSFMPSTSQSASTSSPMPGTSGFTQSTVCGICGKLYLSLAGYSNHLVTAHGKTSRYVCDVCGKPFQSKTHFNTHQLAHKQMKPFCCDIDGCDKTFGYKKDMVAHQTLKHGIGEFKVCGICEKSVTPNNLARHMRTHMGIVVKPECPICRARVNDLTRHMKRHSRGTREKKPKSNDK